MPGRTENSIKNFFYSSVRKYTRVLNRDLKVKPLRKLKSIHQNYLLKVICEREDPPSKGPLIKRLIKLCL
jgi:hypothetical protein